MLKSLKSLVGAALFFNLATGAIAQDLPQDLVESLMTQCRPDYHRLCPDVLPGGGRVGRCLNDQQERLSPGCLKAVKFAYAIQVCLPDYKRYCNGLPPGDERIVTCLAQNYGGLLPECERIVRANEPYVDRSQPRYSAYDNRDRDGDKRDYDEKRSYDNKQSYDYKRSYSEDYPRSSYQDRYNGNGRYLGRSYYSGEPPRAEGPINDARPDEDDVEREPIK